MELTAAQIAQFVGGTVEGAEDVVITSVAGLEHGKPGALSFYVNEKYEHYLYTTHCSAVLVPPDYTPESSLAPTLIRVAKPYEAFNQILTAHFNVYRSRRSGVHPTAIVAADVKLPDDVYIGPGAVIEAGATIGQGVHVFANSYIGKHVSIGAQTVIFPQVCVYYDCEIGANCILHAGCVIGSDGFGFLVQDGQNVKIPQAGKVILEDDVEIGSCSTIDRATLGATIVKRGAKIDNLVHLAHNCVVGENTFIAAQTGIAGSTRIGKNCKIGGQVGIVGHVIIADGTTITAQSGISKNIKEAGGTYRGSPGRELKAQLRLEVLQNQLPQLLSRIEALEEALKHALNPQEK